MPFRTRDFILFLLTVAFMVVGITTTIKNDLTSKDHQAMVILYNNSTSSVDYNAVLPETPVDERPSRLTALREKIAEVLNNDNNDSVAVEEEEILAVTPPEKLPPETLSKNSVFLCSNYSPSQLNWNPKGLQFEIIEGARILYRDTSDPTITGTTTSELREVVLQLPLRTAPHSVQSCLKTDVIGIAFDSSLIRNDEQTIYQIFDSETLIGYALDGFPIYGLNNSLATDECGGTVIAGQYRYYLSPERKGVLGCFSDNPVGF